MFANNSKKKQDCNSEFMRNLLRTMANFKEIEESDMNDKTFREGLTPGEHQFAIMFLTVSKFRKEIMVKMSDQVKREVKEQTKSLS